MESARTSFLIRVEDLMEDGGQEALDGAGLDVWELDHDDLLAPGVSVAGVADARTGEHLRVASFAPTVTRPETYPAVWPFLPLVEATHFTETWDGGAAEHFRFDGSGLWTSAVDDVRAQLVAAGWSVVKPAAEGDAALNEGPTLLGAFVKLDEPSPRWLLLVGTVDADDEWTLYLAQRDRLELPQVPN